MKSEFLKEKILVVVVVFFKEFKDNKEINS